MDDNPVAKPPQQSSFRSLADNIRALPPTTLVIFAILTLLLINTIVVDFKIFTEKQIDTAQLNTAVTQSAACSPACNDLIDNKLSEASASNSALFALSFDLTPTQGSVSKPTPTRAPTPTLIPPFTYTPTPIPLAKEFFIPLGSGFGTATSWTTIDGIGATLNPANYPNTANTYFEVTVRIPTGNQTAQVRLYNATTGSVVANTTLSTSGGTSTLLTSPSISLPSGNNSYQVQIMTQLGYTTYIDQSRIHIITN